MKCPFCGYDKIQPNFNFCPRCCKVLKGEKIIKEETLNEYVKETIEPKPITDICKSLLSSHNYELMGLIMPKRDDNEELEKFHRILEKLNNIDKDKQ